MPMLPNIKYYNVNWVDGMKLSSTHFVEQENAIIDHLRDVAALNLTSYNYGLLAATSGDSKSLNFKVEVDRTQLMRVHVNECRAITPAGARIEITGANQFNQSKPANLVCEYNLSGISPGKILHIVVSVNPFGKTPVGEPSVHEAPPRYPYTDSKYEISVIPAEESKLITNGPFHITIGKLKVTGNSVEVIEKYIPPCAKVVNHAELLEIYHDLSKALSKIETDSGVIIQKIYRKDQQNTLAKSVLYLTEHLMQYLSMNVHHFRWFVPEMPPIFMVEYFASFARVIKNFIDMKSGTGKEELLTYIKDWIVEVNQGEFEAILDNMINIEYNHMDIDASITIIESFCVTLTTVISKLSKLDYIGDKKKADVIVTSREADIVETPKKRSFLLD